MEEMLDVFDENGKRIGVKPRSYFEGKNKPNCWYRAAWVWIVNSEGQILIQKRSALKKVGANKWDMPAAGHVSAGETPLTTAKRETFEELGILAKKQDFLFLREFKNERRIASVYLLHSNAKISEIKIQKEEVSAVKWISFEEFEKFVYTDDFSPLEKEYKDWVCQMLKEKICMQKNPETLAVEVGMELDKSLVYYHEMLINHGLQLHFACETHDVYFSNQNLDGLTENQMKKACVRLRYVRGFNQKEKYNFADVKKEEERLTAQGYKKVFDTIKLDFQYDKEGMTSRVQIQDIKDVGLICYYDNEKFYHFPLDKQRKALFDELNSFGFNFKKTDLGLDKLRTLFYGKKMYSKNQNA